MNNNTEYSRTLKLLRKDATIFAGFVKLVPPINAAQIKSVLKHSKTLAGSEEVKGLLEPIVNKKVDNILNKKKRSWSTHGKEFPTLLREYDGLLTDKVRTRVLNRICTGLKDFYTYSRKEILEITVPWVEDESTAIKIIQLHHRCLKVDAIDHLLSKIECGTGHGDLKKLKATSLPFVARDLKGLDLDNPKDRHKFINSIAKTPSVLKLIGDVDITLTLEDLKNLPPSRRFDFLNYLYTPVFGVQWGGKYSGNISQTSITRAIRRYGNVTRIPIDDIHKDDIKDLLFSVSMRKNEKVSVWWNRYEQYKNITTKKGFVKNLNMVSKNRLLRKGYK